MTPSLPRTALITGASSGIGAEFARQLASQGYHLTITARREPLLTELAKTLEAQYGVVVNVIPADLTLLEGVHEIAQHLLAQPPDVLVSNAGFGLVGRFAQVETHKLQAMVDLHVSATVQLCRAALPGMVQRGSGNIIIVASMAGLAHLRSAIYSSTKAFQISLARVLNYENGRLGVYVQALCPGYTVTGFHSTPEYQDRKQRRLPRLFWLSNEQVVRHSLKDMQHQREVSIPGLHYRLAALVINNRLLRAAILRYLRT